MFMQTTFKDTELLDNTENTITTTIIINNNNHTLDILLLMAWILTTLLVKDNSTLQSTCLHLLQRMPPPGTSTITTIQKPILQGVRVEVEHKQVGHTQHKTQ